MVIRTELVGDREVIARLDERTARADEAMRVGIGRLALKLQKLVVQSKLQGQVLKVRSGTLSRSIAQGVFDEAGKIVGTVSTNLFYGIGWELGWPGRGDKPSLESAKARFSLGSSTMFKNGTPKERSFLRSALRDLEASGVIREELDAAAARIAG